MATYAITAVRYDIDRSRILTVRIHPMDADRLGAPLEVTRDEFLITVQFGGDFLTLREDRGGRHFQSAPVRLVRLRGGAYLRCDSNPWPLDDLGGVPEY